MSDFQRSLFQNKLKRLELLLNLQFDDGDDYARGREDEEEEEQDIITPLLGSSSNRLRNSRAKTTYPSWNEFFDFNEVYEISPNFKFNTYYKKPLNRNKNPVIFICHHGAGSSGLTFAQLSRSLQKIFDEKNKHKLDTNEYELPGLFLFDIRGHSQTAILNDDEKDFSINQLCLDFLSIFEEFITRQDFEKDEIKPSLFFIGHSLGGSVLSKVIYDDYIKDLDHANLIKGLVMLDIVEDAAIHSLTLMTNYLDKTPKSFKTLEECIKWHMDSKLVNNEESAKISVPSYFKYDKEKALYYWITDLYNTQPFWSGWFEGLSSRFVAIKSSVAKLLILSGHDNLDKPLMIGQMQGKYQLVVFQQDIYIPELGRRQHCGHFVHEDCPDKVAITLLDYVERNDISRSDKAIVIKWGSMRS